MKTRPKKPDETIDAVRTHTIDHRTRQGKALKRLKADLTDRPISAGKAILKAIVAQNTVISNEIFNAALNTTNLLDEKGKLNPMIQKELLKFQAAAKTALIELLKLETTAKQDGDPEDIFGDVFDE